MSVEGIVKALKPVEPDAGVSADDALTCAPETPQFAALCYRIAKGRPQILMITSRDTGRWLLPKGWPIDGLSPALAAAREAFEEAGVQGAVCETEVGRYSYLKLVAAGVDVPCVVTVYALNVQKVCGSYPEKSQRKRKWVSPKRAASMAQEPELRQILAGFDGSAIATAAQKAAKPDKAARRRAKA